MSDTTETKLPVEFKADPGGPVNVSVVPSTKNPKGKGHPKKSVSKKLADAKTFHALGLKVLKISAAAMKEIGSELGSLGVREIGHGRIFLAGETAVESLAACDETLAQLQQRDPPCDPEAIIGVLRIKREFASLLLESGEAHIRATKQADPDAKANPMSVSFPPNSAMMLVAQSPSGQQ